ncbi:hypothetical protein CDL15_Pgr019473 [Punica granatum]|uniref:PB1-like domain-containing protein n=1 Tax=Punica granatum TaxID=22663 RepID=A0A218VSJ8_PUNGR|nr:hypothetical protein CDL15_Pgr019473 [Punica granatum]
MEDDNHKFVCIPRVYEFEFVLYSLHLWKIVDVYLHHEGNFVGEPKVGYEGGDVDIIRNIDVDTITVVRVCDLLLDVYKTVPTSCHYRDNTFKTFDLAINNFESDLDVRYLISVLQYQTELHLYYEHGQVHDLLELNEKEIRELKKVEAERRK